MITKYPFERRLSNGKTLYFLFLCLLIILISPILFRVNAEEPEIRSLTEKLLNPEIHSLSAEDTLTIAKQRYTLLEELSISDPNTFLQEASLFDLKSSFSEEIQKYIEEKKDLEGVLKVHIIDSIKDSHEEDHETLYILESADQSYNLHFAEDHPEILSGSIVRTKGIGIGSNIVMQSAQYSTESEYSMETITASTTSTNGPQETLIMLIKFNDTDPEIITREKVAQVFFDQPANPYPPHLKDTIDEYYRMNSYNQISFPGSINNIYGWYNINRPMGSCVQNHSTWSQEAKNIAINLDSNDPAYIDPTRFEDPNLRIVYIFNIGSFVCGGYNGFGTLGGSPSESWITNADPTSIGGYIAHELGHNLGLHHANAIFCGTILYTNDCLEAEYGDPYDVMGDLTATGTWKLHFNGAHKADLGWLGGDQVQEANTDGTYTIKPLASSDPGFKVIKIQKSDTGEYYYLSYRQKINYDAFMIPETITRGVSIHISNGNPARKTKLLDGTPNSKSAYPPNRDFTEFSDSSLFDNGEYTDHINQIKFTQISHNAQEVKVKIEFLSSERNNDIGTWQTLEDLPRNRQGHSVVRINENVFSFGGSNQQKIPTKFIYQTKIKPDGTLEPWFTSNINLPDKFMYQAAVVKDRNIYLIGGYSQNDNGYYSYSNKVYRSTLQSDNTLSTWTELSTLPIGISKAKAVVYNNNIIVSGGFKGFASINNIFAASINPDGTLSTWRQIGTLPKNVHDHNMIINNGKIYIIGGTDWYQSQIYIHSTTIDPDLTLGTVWKKSYLPMSLSESEAFVFNNKLYVMGGNRGGNDNNVNYPDYRNEIYALKILENGNIDTRSQSINLPEKLSYTQSFIYQNKLYLIGGRKDDQTAESKTYKANLQFIDLSLESTSRDSNYYRVNYCNTGTYKSASKFLIKIKNQSNGKEFTSNPLYPFELPEPGQCIWSGGFTCGLIGSDCSDNVDIQFELDSTNQIEEISKINNQKIQKFVAQKPDLVIEQIIRDSKYYRAYICNRGNTYSTSQYTIRINNLNNGKSYQSNALYPYSVPQPGQCQWSGGFTCSLIGSNCYDSVQIQMTIDDTNKVNEGNETNNVMNKSFYSNTVQPVELY